MVRSGLSEEVHLCKDLNEGRGEPPFLGKGLPGARVAGAKALSLVRTWQVGGAAEELKSARSAGIRACKVVSGSQPSQTQCPLSSTNSFPYSLHSLRLHVK